MFKRSFQDFELPFVPTMLVVFLALFAAVVSTEAFRVVPDTFWESNDCRFDASTETLIAPGGKIPDGAIHAACRMADLSGVEQFSIADEKGRSFARFRSGEIEYLPLPGR